MKKEEIEQAAKEYSGLIPSKIGFINGSEFVNERQPYSKEDMKLLSKESYKQGFSAALDSLRAAYKSIV